MRPACLAAILLSLAACTGVDSPGPVACGPERPQVCTMEYDPSCGQLLAGGERDYSSPCNACADDTVASYVTGACDRAD